ncbi:hypothetical protein GW17_00013168, partial [Ensete ventricosum]
FLRKIYTSAQECPRSYDKLRFDPRFYGVSLIPVAYRWYLSVYHTEQTWYAGMDRFNLYFLFDSLCLPENLSHQLWLNAVQRDARELGRLRKTEEFSDPYDMEDMIMPLHEFINDPIAHDIIHNGATFQV